MDLPSIEIIYFIIYQLFLVLIVEGNHVVGRESPVGIVHVLGEGFELLFLLRVGIEAVNHAFQFVHFVGEILIGSEIPVHVIDHKPKEVISIFVMTVVS